MELVNFWKRGSHGIRGTDQQRMVSRGFEIDLTPRKAAANVQRGRALTRTGKTVDEQDLRASHGYVTPSYLVEDRSRSRLPGRLARHTCSFHPARVSPVPLRGILQHEHVEAGEHEQDEREERHQADPDDLFLPDQHD